MRKVGISKWKAFQLWNAFSITIFVFLVGNSVVNGTISIGSIFIFYSYLMRLTEGASDLTEIIDEVIEDKAAIARMMPIYWETLPVHEGDKLFPKEWKTITISDGFFSYGKSEADQTKEHFALRDITVTIRRNEKIGVVGHSGGGKSTFAKLLLGLYDLEKGSFQVDTVNFYDIKHSEVTRRISTVLQESEMFNLSLRENITLLRAVPEELFKKAISIAQLAELIEKLPDGLDTLIGEKGYRVSGGERQRIGIARAICKDPDILVLDEATSALDSKTENKIQEALEKELQQKTFIIIAHRISTLREVERIIVFDQGRIVEEGNYASLIHDHTSKFYEVYTMQHKQ
jgi:ABC-type multidrug transport system fused ATPase/permease subunit